MYDGDHRFAFPSYHFPCHLLPVDKPCKSKHLCLPRIGSFLPNGSIRQVPLICVEYIPLHQSDIDSILSGRLNLTWLRSCCSKMRLTLYIHGQFLSMKTLNIAGPTFYRVELKTINLESFRVSRFDPNCVFVGVPFLKKGSLLATMWSSSIARMLIATDLPRLQFLSLFFTSEVCEEKTMSL